MLQSDWMIQLISEIGTGRTQLFIAMYKNCSLTYAQLEISKGRAACPVLKGKIVLKKYFGHLGLG